MSWNVLRNSSTRRAKDRERQREINQAGARSAPLFTALAIALVAIGGLWQHIAVALLGGVFTVLGPVLLWIAYVLRPDQRPGEDL